MIDGANEFSIAAVGLSGGQVHVRCSYFVADIAGF
jgi:hypothetical protein